MSLIMGNADHTGVAECLRNPHVLAESPPDVQVQRPRNGHSPMGLCRLDLAFFIFKHTFGP